MHFLDQSEDWVDWKILAEKLGYKHVGCINKQVQSLKKAGYLEIRKVKNSTEVRRG